MNKIKISIMGSVLALTIGCNPKEAVYDASGVFEATEVLVSSEVGGRVSTLVIEEGTSLKKGQLVGNIDPTAFELQKQQVQASLGSLNQKTGDAGPQLDLIDQQIKLQKNQVEAIQLQLRTLVREKDRIEKLVSAEAAPTKQLDDINAQQELMLKQLDAANQQINVMIQQKNTQKRLMAIQNKAIMSEQAPLQKRKQSVEDQLERTHIINPFEGTVLAQYVYEGEVTAPGKAIYKIADLKKMILKVYITGDQLAKVKIGQAVQVFTDDGDGGYKKYDGTISAISEKAEFTPKTIQTKKERANLVYPTKIKILNDGLLKIGMYGHVQF